ncbi:hypothetical protein EJB05_17110 [Eragrostis curvula]|uniref:Subtilisin-like protease fibronectin type-III domain-containing protein n=1 Tax=Eragrostis curvula TaxID=38414 RepID=A0A5J9VG27_9POAL|nr:hypothetical protein EJB05_17110 [Eragrostis curvula]
MAVYKQMPSRPIPQHSRIRPQRKMTGGALTLQSLLLFFLVLCSCSTISASAKQDQVYIVYLGEHDGAKATDAVLEDHHSLLLSVKGSEEAARASLLYSYKHTLNGFAAILSEEEARELSGRSEVVSTFRSEARWAPHTTRSWEFLGFEEGRRGPGDSDWLPSLDKSGSDVIVGVLDSGIWPESRSFSDEGLGPVPARWKGVCQGGDSFSPSSCNRKIIGARYYLKEYEAYYHGLNTTYAYRSPRDHDGHGTHTASTVAGRVVRGASALGGFAAGAASGGAPLARVAAYKVCWPIPGPNPNMENTCFEADMLAAMDDAVGDGVDVMSVSIGSVGAPLRFADDGIAVGALHAARRGVVVVCSGGNSGPKPATVSNLAPWLLTVAASSIDRAFDSPVKLGNGVAIMGQTVTPYQLPGNKPYPLIYAADAVVPGTPANVTNQCLPNSLSTEKVRGKIVVCLRGSGARVEKGLEVKRAGGAAILLGNPPASGSEVPVDAHVLPGTAVSADDAITILKYINSSSNPTAILDRSRTVVDVRPSPVMAQFSSRGPNVLEPNILKVPTVNNAEGGPIKNGDGSVAGPMDYGAGHIRPRHALDPGLVYDASYQDYLLFACASAGAQLDPALPCPASPPPPYQLNYPSVAVHGLNGTVTVRRTVTNVGAGEARYTVAVIEPAGVSVKVSPKNLKFARAGEKKTFKIKIQAKGTSTGNFSAGSYAWSDGVHVVRSPIVVLAA